MSPMMDGVLFEPRAHRDLKVICSNSHALPHQAYPHGITDMANIGPYTPLAVNLCFEAMEWRWVDTEGRLWDNNQARAMG